MPSSVGIRELKTHAGEIVRRVRDERATIDITYRGEVVAHIVPVNPVTSANELESIWEERRRLAEAIGSQLIGEQDAVDAVREQRRDLLADIARHGHDDVSAVDAVREIRRDL